MTPAVIVHCQALGRSLEHILDRVPDAVVFDAPLAPNHAGCIAGHQHAVALARRHGWDAVTVFEDDCHFTDAFSTDQWCEDIDWASAHGFSMLNGGCYRVKQPRPVRDGLVAVTRFKSAHCVAYLPQAFGVVDRLVYPMDYMLGKLGAQAVVTVPFVAIQAPGTSGHLDVFTDYADDYREQADRLGALCKS